MSDPRCWRRPGSSPPLADPAITVVSLIATGDGDLACDDSFVPPRDRPRIHAGRQFRVLGAGTCRSPHHKTGADCGPASPKRARPRPRRKRRPTDRHCRALPGSTTRRRFHTLGAGSCRSPHHETGAEKGPPNPHHETGAGPKRSAAQPTGAGPKRSAAQPTGAGSKRSAAQPTGADPKRSAAQPTGSARAARAPRQQHSAPVPPTRRRNMPEPTPRNRRRVRPASPAAKLDARKKRTAVPTGTPRTPRQQHARAPHPERDAHRPSYERPNGSSPAGRGAAGPYPTTLARTAAENSAGCSITLGAAIR